MKKMIVLALKSLINNCVSEGRQFADNTEKLAQRLALIVPEERFEMLVDGVPVKLTIIDESKTLETLSKRIGRPVADIKIRKAEIAYDFDGKIHFGVKQTRYAKTEEAAKQFEGTEDYYSTSSSQDETYQFPFQCWKCDSVDFTLNEEQIAKYGVQVEYL